ncbi:MAG: DNA primase [Crenarchaeota archaeon]|nr:DNA primase [Thermoproteota archaeon]
MLPRVSSNLRYLKSLFRQYYSTGCLEEPTYIHKREIGVQLIGEKSYRRHLSFPSMTMLYKFIVENPPLHLYYSSAYYDDPSANDMGAKGWRGSDLLFDIDSDHYEGCNSVITFCLKCGKSFEGSYKKCPRCGSGNVVTYPIIGFDCIKRAYNDALKIKTVLKDDYGLSNIKAYFSGNRGFHVKCFDDNIIDLTGDERRELAMYVSLNGLEPSIVFPPITRRKIVVFTTHEYGIRKRVFETLYDKSLIRRRGLYYEADYDDVLVSISDNKVDIDTVVTMDISRLSRFGGSINGKSGLVVLPVSNELPSSYQDFSPWDGTIVIKPLIDFSGLPVLGNKVSLKTGISLRVKTYIGVYLALKGLARIENIDRVEIRKCMIHS